MMFSKIPDTDKSIGQTLFDIENGKISTVLVILINRSLYQYISLHPWLV